MPAINEVKHLLGLNHRSYIGINTPYKYLHEGDRKHWEQGKPWGGRKS